MNNDKSDKVYICRKCNKEMNEYGSKQNGNYFVCKSCKEITMLG
jgi:DNA-directed RNA polymerase subunit RPC12/RpoP